MFFYIGCYVVVFILCYVFICSFLSVLLDVDAFILFICCWLLVNRFYFMLLICRLYVVINVYYVVCCWFVCCISWFVCCSFVVYISLVLVARFYLSLLAFDLSFVCMLLVVGWSYLVSFVSCVCVFVFCLMFVSCFSFLLICHLYLCCYLQTLHCVCCFCLLSSVIAFVDRWLIVFIYFVIIFSIFCYC